MVTDEVSYVSPSGYGSSTVLFSPSGADGGNADNQYLTAGNVRLTVCAYKSPKSVLISLQPLEFALIAS